MQTLHQQEHADCYLTH